MAKKQNSNTNALGFSTGVVLAIQMLNELERDQKVAELCNVESQYRPAGTSQKNIVLEYLDSARTSGREVEAGFAAILSSFVADCRNGCVPDTENYVPCVSRASHA